MTREEVVEIADVVVKVSAPLLELRDQRIAALERQLVQLTRAVALLRARERQRAYDELVAAAQADLYDN